MGNAQEAVAMTAPQIVCLAMARVHPFQDPTSKLCSSAVFGAKQRVTRMLPGTARRNSSTGLPGSLPSKGTDAEAFPVWELQPVLLGKWVVQHFPCFHLVGKASETEHQKAQRKMRSWACSLQEPNSCTSFVQAWATGSCQQRISLARKVHCCSGSVKVVSSRARIIANSSSMLLLVKQKCTRNAP